MDKLRGGGVNIAAIAEVSGFEILLTSFLRFGRIGGTWRTIMTDKAKPFPPHASMSTPELIARLRSCTTSIFGEWEAADRLA